MPTIVLPAPQGRTIVPKPLSLVAYKCAGSSALVFADFERTAGGSFFAQGNFQGLSVCKGNFVLYRPAGLKQQLFDGAAVGKLD